MTAHIIRSCFVTSHAKTKQGLSGASRLNPYLRANHRLTAVGMRQKALDRVKRSEALIHIKITKFLCLEVKLSQVFQALT